MFKDANQQNDDITFVVIAAEEGLEKRHGYAANRNKCDLSLISVSRLILPLLSMCMNHYYTVARRNTD